MEIAGDVEDGALAFELAFILEDTECFTLDCAALLASTNCRIARLAAVLLLLLPLLVIVLACA